MLNLMFFIKTLIVTFLIVALLQVHVGSSTLEDHASRFIRTSPIMSPIQAAAESGARAVRQSTNWISAQVNKKWKGSGQRKEQAERALNFDFKRSESYEKSRSTQDEE